MSRAEPTNSHLYSFPSDAATAILGAHNLSTSEVLPVAGSYSGSAGMRQVQVLAFASLSPPFHKKPFQPHDGQCREVGMTFSPESFKTLLERLISDVTLDRKVQ